MSFLLRKVELEDVTTISKPRSLTVVRINDLDSRKNGENVISFRDMAFVARSLGGP